MALPPMNRVLPLRTRRQWIIAFLLAQAIVIVCLQLWFRNFGSWLPHSFAPALVDSSSQYAATPGAPSALLLREGPTTLFRDNLRPDVKYITTWPANGWSNQVIEYMNILYVARLTGRVPIIPRFRPVHLVDNNVAHLDFSDVFDLPRLRRELDTPVLEWRDVKDLGSDEVEELGCWDLRHKTWERERVYLETPVDLHLDVSYTPVPKWLRDVGEPTEFDRGMFLWPLASFVAFNERARILPGRPDPVVSQLRKTVHPPDDHLFCVNTVYTGIQLLEDKADISTAWQDVGRHMHWTPALHEIARNYTRQTLGIDAAQEIPPYIAVHVRHGDFTIWCNIDGIPLSRCFAPISKYAERVAEIRAEILKDTGVDIDRVIVTSDEVDSRWWDSVRALGWLRPDHSRTIELHGPWYPVFIDAVMQGDASGFVGTDTSTVSILARRRVAARGGPTEMVKWGKAALGH
ncbi:hypothetical protein C8R46DRAFT_1361718 [Mycena filopes]|nr:hypothetical protein C8R46DRAFT_1361718 [Mycena filopes]